MSIRCYVRSISCGLSGLGRILPAVLSIGALNFFELKARSDEGASISRPSSSKAFNPDISVNFLTLMQKDSLGGEDRTQSPHNGIQLQEAELQLFSDVDPYFTANALLSVSQKAGSTDYGIDPEEVFVDSTFIPGATLRLGKFKAALGKQNTLHTHAYPFIDAPLINQELLGDEGLNDAGASAAVLMPTSWYMEVTAQALASGNDTFFNSPQAGDWVKVGQVKNLWDLSDSATLEWALYGTSGTNAARETSSAWGSDLTLKWRPEEGGKYTSLIVSQEFLQGTRSPGDSAARSGFGRRTLGGYAGWIQYQFAERWWAQGRAEWLGLTDSSILPTKKKQSVLFAFNFSEFSGTRLQFDHVSQTGVQADEYRLALQWSITIGAHPAHAY